jgi:hypothetical protein
MIVRPIIMYGAEYYTIEGQHVRRWVQPKCE